MANSCGSLWLPSAFFSPFRWVGTTTQGPRIPSSDPTSPCFCPHWTLEPDGAALVLVAHSYQPDTAQPLSMNVPPPSTLPALLSTVAAERETQSCVFRLPSHGVPAIQDPHVSMTRRESLRARSGEDKQHLADRFRVVPVELHTRIEPTQRCISKTVGGMAPLSRGVTYSPLTR